jgi:hypothetical protein
MASETRVFWLYGKSGTGKTRLARAKLEASFGEYGFYVFPAFNSFGEFACYNLERGMLIDDYDSGEIPAEKLVGIITRNPPYVDPGYGQPMRPLRTELVYVTSLRPPWDHFPHGSPILGMINAVDMNALSGVLDAIMAE